MKATLLPLSTPVVTQKAKSILALCRNANLFVAGGPITIAEYYVRTPEAFPVLFLPTMSDEDVKAQFLAVGRLNEQNYRMLFLRPCPKTPRHGFVESEAIEAPVSSDPSFLDAYVLPIFKQKLQAARSLDPQAELVVMPCIMDEELAAVSAVITPNSVTWGRGNAGVTSGSGAKVIPIPGAHKAVMLGLLSLGNIGVFGSYYIEVVAPDGGDEAQAVAVQIREGPSVKGVSRYVQGGTVEVKEVVPSWAAFNQSLLAWETTLAMVKEYGPTEGVVVHLPGRSLSSHFAVQAIQSGFSVECDMEAPKIGEVLASEEIAPLNKDSFSTLASLLPYYLLEDIGRWPKYRQVEAAALAVAVLHSEAVWGCDAHLLRLRAAGLAYATRMILVACLSECRYFGTEGPKTYGCNEYTVEETVAAALRRDGRPALIPWREMLPSLLAFRVEEGGKSSVSANRDNIYEVLLSARVQDLYRWGRFAVYDLFDPWKESYGGEAWRDVLICAMRLVEELLAFTADPTAKGWGSLWKKYNALVNMAHNSGKVLSKWLVGPNDEPMSTLARHPEQGFGNTLTAKIVLDGLGTKQIGAAASTFLAYPLVGQKELPPFPASEDLSNEPVAEDD